MLMIQFLLAGCLGLSLSISSQFMLLQQKIAKKSRKPLFKGSKSFKVINVDNTKKPVTSACYAEQHVCAYLQPFSC